MNRNQRRTLAHNQRQFAKTLPEALTLIDPSAFPALEHLPIRAWRNRKYVVQLYAETSTAFPGLLRLTVTRASIDTQGKFQAEITWDELQAIKREVGFGDWYGVEVYPRDCDVVNESNMRHLWLLPVDLPIGWLKGSR